MTPLDPKKPRRADTMPGFNDPTAQPITMQQTGAMQPPTMQTQGAFEPPPLLRPAQQAPEFVAPNPVTAPGVQAFSAPAFSPTQAGPRGPAPEFSAPSPVTAPGVSAGRAQAQTFDMESYRPFIDAVMSEQRRHLDPRFQGEEAAFRQRMVNQGIQEGTPAFDTAYGNFARAREDAYSSAANQALLQGLGAQNQMFGQSLANEQLGQQASIANAANALQAAGMNQQANALSNAFAMQRAQFGEGQRQFDAGLGASQGQFGAQLGLQGAQLGQQASLANAANALQAAGMNQQANALANAFAMQRAQFGEGQRQFDAQFGEGQRQFDTQFGFQGQRADMSDLMALLGYGQQATAFNNQALLSDQQRAGALFGLIPGLTPTQLDVMGPANAQLQAQMNAQNAAASRQNGLFGALGQLGSAFIGMPRVGG